MLVSLLIGASLVLLSSPVLLAQRHGRTIRSTVNSNSECNVTSASMLGIAARYVDVTLRSASIVAVR